MRCFLNSSSIITLYDQTLLLFTLFQNILTSNQSFNHPLDLQRVGEPHLDKFRYVRHVNAIFFFTKVSVECSVSGECVLPASVIDFRVWDLNFDVCACFEIQLEQDQQHLLVVGFIHCRYVYDFLWIFLVPFFLQMF